MRFLLLTPNNLELLLSNDAAFSSSACCFVEFKASEHSVFTFQNSLPASLTKEKRVSGDVRYLVSIQYQGNTWPVLPIPI